MAPLFFRQFGPKQPGDKKAHLHVTPLSDFASNEEEVEAVKKLQGFKDIIEAPSLEEAERQTFCPACTMNNGELKWNMKRHPSKPEKR